MLGRPTLRARASNIIAAPKPNGFLRRTRTPSAQTSLAFLSQDKSGASRVLAGVDRPGCDFSWPEPNDALALDRISRLFLLHQPRDSHQTHRTNKGNNNRSDQSACVEPQHAEHPAAYDAPENPENDVHDNSIAAALHHLAGKPPGNEPHNNPRKESHFGSSCSIVWEAPNASPI